MDGAAVIDIANRERPDLITTGMALPVKTGWEVIEELKIRDDTQGIRIVALSGDVSWEICDAGHVEGCVTYIGESVNKVALLQTIDGLLELS